MAEQEKDFENMNPWLACLPTMTAAFMFVLDATIANVALPHMAGSFSVSRDESMWILTSYLIASGIVIPMVDWFSKAMGRKACGYPRYAPEGDVRPYAGAS